MPPGTAEVGPRPSTPAHKVRWRGAQFVHAYYYNMCTSTTPIPILSATHVLVRSTIVTYRATSNVKITLAAFFKDIKEFGSCLFGLK